MCDCAALLGLVNELMGGNLLAPAAQELRPSTAATQWADAGVTQEVTPQAWASLGVEITHQVLPRCTHSVLTQYSELTFIHCQRSGETTMRCNLFGLHKAVTSLYL